jgi:hypothetical protein
VFGGKLLKDPGKLRGAKILIDAMARPVENSLLKNKFLIENKAFLLAKMTKAEVPKNAMKPSINRRLTAKAMRGFECLEESFLNEILGLGFVAAQQPCGTKQAVTMRVDQFLKINRRRTFKSRIALKLRHILLVPKASRWFKLRV